MSVTDYGNNHKQIELSAVCDNAIPENEAFTKYTPSGDMKFMVNNTAVHPMFVPNQEYYIDITSAEPVDGEVSKEGD